MSKFKIVIAKRYKNLDALCDEMIARKRTIKIDEIVDMVKDFSKQNEGIFDDIIISDDRNHNNKTFFDSRFPSHPHNKEFSGINYHSAANPRGVFPAAVNQLCKFLRMAYTLRVGSQVLEEMKETTAAPKWRIVEAKLDKEADLREWFKKEKWVDLRRPKKDGKGYEPCGRGDTSKGKKPVCTPANKAKNINKKERTQRLKEKAKKEKEPNPDKKPNVTKYSPGAGGKSKASDSHNIRFVGSMIPLSDLGSQKFRLAAFGEEDDIPTTDISHLFGESDEEDDKLTKNFLEKVASALSEKLGNMLGLTGPGVDQSTERISKMIESLGKANTDKLDEVQQRRFDNAKYYVLHTIGQNAIDTGNLNLFEVCNVLAEPGKNPFSYSDVKLVIQGMLNR
jgi:hypothetical protein